MRLAEGNCAARQATALQAAESVPRPGRQFAALLAVPLAGALLMSPAALAQDNALPTGIKQRIERTFALVLSNPEELAIPLTRRALARRLNEDQSLAVAPLAYGATEEPKGQEDEGEVAEEGSADPADEDLARLPRPRPADDVAAAAPAARPVDLVASAPAAAPDAVVVPAGQPTADVELVAHVAAEPEAAPAEEPPRELVANRSCLSPGQVADPDDDFARNAEELSDSTLCIAEEKFKERRRPWTIQTVTSGRPGPLFAVMHDDEGLSFDTAVRALKTFGGTLVAMETGGKRNQDGIDPNRNFSADGIGCKKLGEDASPRFTAFFRALLKEDQPVIALHNNTGERIPTGGLGHVTMDDVPRDMEPRDAVDPDGPLAGDRTLVLLTSPVPVSATSRARADALAARGINAVVEPIREGSGDCSLSNYTLLIGHPDYFNVTVDKGEGDKQIRIIEEILGKPAETVATQ